MRSPLKYARGLLAAGFLFWGATAAAWQIRFAVRDTGTAGKEITTRPALPGSAPLAWVDTWDTDRKLAACRNFPVALEVFVPASAQDFDRLTRWITGNKNIETILLTAIPEQLTTPAAVSQWIFDLKKAAALIRGLRPGVKIALYDEPYNLNPRATDDASEFLKVVAAALDDPTLAPDIDALLLRSGDLPRLGPESPVLHLHLWLTNATAGAAENSADNSVSGVGTAMAGALELLRRFGADRYFFSGFDPKGFYPVVERLQNYFTPDVSATPRESAVTVSSGTATAACFYDAATLSPLCVVGGGYPAPPEARLPLAGGPFRLAEAENLMTGHRRTFPLTAGSKALTLDLSRGPLVVRLLPAETPGGAGASVNVAATQELTADEIVARERAWQAAQDELWSNYTADLKTSLRFHIAEVNETFDLTIEGPLFKERGKPFDWAWREFYLNGVRWKGKTLPKLPILQPEKVTTLPLDIELAENYDYAYAGKTRLNGREAFEITFTPKISAGNKPLYKGTAWIDEATFALLKRRSVQENLTGETLSNIETEFYKPVPSAPGLMLPLEILGEEVFSTAGRTTAIERKVDMTNVRVNPPDFQARRAAVYASPSQMVRDTNNGLRYLVPDPLHAGQRLVEQTISRKSLFGVAGAFYDGSVSYPIPLAGIQYFNFDLWKKGKQLSLFFGGALLTANYTDPSFLGSRFDVGADLFAVAFSFTDTDYQNGHEVLSERLKHLPAVFQVNVGHPLGPYLKASLGLFTKYDRYARDSHTAGNFVTPDSTETVGAEVKLAANVAGWSGDVAYSVFHRADWPVWGIPGMSEYNPSQRNYQKYSASISKDVYFSKFRKFHAKLSYLDGSNLDRFSRYEFGVFSGNPLHGYQSGALRTRQAWLMNLSYGLNIEDIIRLEGVYDQAVINDPVSGFRHQYFSGAGVSGQLNGPWNNSLIRFDVGVPVVSHGIHGFSVSALILKLF